MEDQDFMRHVLGAALQECAAEMVAPDSEKGQIKPGVMILGNVTIHGGLHLNRCAPDAPKPQ